MVMLTLEVDDVHAYCSVKGLLNRFYSYREVLFDVKIPINQVFKQQNSSKLVS